MPPSTRCGTIALAGRPNAGKSSLLNALVGEALAIVSPKPQSTRQPVVGLRTDDDTQLLFTDPAGLLDPAYPLQDAMVEEALTTLRQADAILYLHPCPDGPPPPLAHLLPDDVRPRAPVLTVLTKGDLTGPETRPPPATEHLVVSATTGEGLDDLLAWCRRHAPPGPFRYDPDALSPQPLRFFVAEYVREAAFAVLGQELPYALAAETDEFREGSLPLYIRVVLYVERESQKGMVVGKGGRTIRDIGSRARARIETLLGTRVYLDLWVKTLPRWRATPGALRRLGFTLPSERPT